MALSKNALTPASDCPSKNSGLAVTLHHPDAVLARAAARLADEPFGLLAVAPGRLCQVKVQPAAPRVDVGVARVLLLPPLIVGLDVVNAGALVFCKTQYRILRLRH